jgi:hypothetical protein
MAKVKVTARKYGGNDEASWAIFRSDRTTPVYTGLYKREVAYYKRDVERMMEERK